MDRELALEMVRVTEKAALSSARWIGKGEKNRADEAAVMAMRSLFDTVAMKGEVVIGEGEMDLAPMLYIGESVGNGEGPEVDVAVDPLEGTELVAKGLDQALAVVAIAPKGRLLHAPDMYMEKLAVGPNLAGRLSLADRPEDTMRKAAEIIGKPLSDLTVSLLERDRHEQLLLALRKIGVRIKLLPAGDVAGAIAPAFSESGVDLYIGSGGAPEGVLAAAALRCLGGELQGRLMPETKDQYDRCLAMGIRDPRQILYNTDLAGTDDVIFAATGITGGDFLGGVRFLPNEQAETHSLVMRAKTKTVRFIRSLHTLSLEAVSA